MKIPDILPEENYTYTGVNTFPVPFPFYGLDSIIVYYRSSSEPDDISPSTPMVYEADYTVTGVQDSSDDSTGSFSGGAVTLTPVGIAKIGVGYVIVIRRDTPQVQDFTYTELDNFPAKSHENALGRSMAILQEHEVKLNATLQAPPGTELTLEEVSSVLLAARDEATEAAAEAQVSETNAKVSETNAKVSETNAKGSEQTILNIGAGTATASGFTPLAPEGWEAGHGIILNENGTTTYGPVAVDIPAAEAPSDEKPNGVAGIVVPDGETITIEDGKLKGGASYLPGTIVFNFTNTIYPGFVFIDVPSGLIARDAYPQLVNILEKPENSNIFVDDAIWQAEVASFGFTMKYSKGDGSTTFRLPYVTEAFVGASGTNRPMGSAQLDKIKNIVGKSGASYSWPAETEWGAFYKIAGGGIQSGAIVTDRVGFDASRVVRTGDRVEPRAVYARIMLCVSNTSVSVSEQNIQVLTDSLVHKLDISTYQTDNTYSTLEVDTGKKWTNGKTIYRKIVETGALPNNTTKNVAHGITGITAVVKLDGVARRPSTATYISMLYGGTTIVIQLTMTNVILISSIDSSTYTSSFVMLEYTK